ncbi:MAG: Kelch repeat-containing protein [Mucilaginibacter sp.]
MKFPTIKLRALVTISVVIAFLAACKKTPVENLGDPTITGYSTISGNVGDTLWVVGKNFSKIPKNNSVRFSTASAIAIQSKIHAFPQNDSIKVIVPVGATSDMVKLSVLSKTVAGVDTFWVTTGQWIKMASCPSGGRFSGVAFGIGTKGYVGLGTGEGSNGPYLKDFWSFDPEANQWAKKADFPAGPVRECTSFVIGNTGYVCLGTNMGTISPNNTLYAYDPNSDTWIQKANSTSLETVDVVGLAAAGRGYVITGFYSTQFLSYSPFQDTWTTMPNFPGPERSAASGFVINDELYLGGGNSGGMLYYPDLWKYNPSTATWTQLTSAFDGGYPAVSFSLNGKGYRLLRQRSGYKGSAFYEYDPSTNKWAMKKAFPGTAFEHHMAFTADNRAFITGGLVSNGYSPETWEFIP